MKAKTRASNEQENVCIDAEMSTTEIEDALQSANHGVLSLTNGDSAYSVPMSYGYDAESNSFVFQFILHEGSRKQEFVEQTETASFTVSEAGDDEWFSVVAEGPITAVADERTPDVYSTIADSAWFPDLTVFEDSVSNADFELFELSIETIAGKKSPEFDA